jgi:hypothetical protein
MVQKLEMLETADRVCFLEGAMILCSFDSSNGPQSVSLWFFPCSSPDRYPLLPDRFAHAANQVICTDCLFKGIDETAKPI